MLNIIIGPNASGKTAMLRKLLSEISDVQNVVTNLYPLPSFEDIEYSEERIERVEELLEDVSLITTNKGSLAGDIGYHSSNFMKGLTYLCKDVDNVLLDGIENSVFGSEFSTFTGCILHVRDLIPNLWIVTHSSNLKNRESLGNVKYYTVVTENGELKLKEL